MFAWYYKMPVRYFFKYNFNEINYNNNYNHKLIFKLNLKNEDWKRWKVGFIKIFVKIKVRLKKIKIKFLFYYFCYFRKK